MERIKAGSVSLPFYQHREGWRWSWKDANGVWRYGTRKDKVKAKQAAHARALAISKGKLDLDALTETQADLVRRFLALDPTAADLQRLREWRDASNLDLSRAVARWSASKLSELHGIESPHLRNVRQWLEKMAKSFPGVPAASLTVDQLAQHIEAASLNPKSRRDARMCVVALWRFARVHGLFDSTEADKLPSWRSKTDNAVDVWTVAEMRLLLAGCPAEFLPWFALSVFSGLRSEEIAPKPGIKPPLMWEAVDLKRGLINLPAASSKVRKRRLIPITDTLRAWLEYLNPPKRGPVCARLPAEHVTKTLGALVGGWRKNASRHSYGSYRAAITNDLPALALEMGTSFTMIEKHYREAVTSDVARAFWNLKPSEAFRKRKAK